MSDGIGNWLAGGAAGLFPAADLIAGAVPLIPATSSQALIFVICTGSSYT